MDKLDLILNDLDNASDGLENFEYENFTNSLVAKYNLSRNDAAKLKDMNIARNSNPPTIQKAGPSPVVASGAPLRPLMNAAQFDINITRVTANVAGALDVPIFGSSQSESGYLDIVNTDPGISLKDVVRGIQRGFSGANKYVFTYTDGSNDDNLEVTCNQVSYPHFVRSTDTDVFRVSNLRLTLSDPNQVSQFNESLRIVNKSMFGLTSQNTLSPAAYKRPDQFQSGIVDISDVTFAIDKETQVVVPIIAVAAFTVTLSIFVEQFSRRGRNVI